MRNLSKGFATLLMVAICAGIVCGQVLVRDIPAPSLTASSLCWDGTGFWVGDNSASLVKVNIENGARLDTVVGPVTGSRGLSWDGTSLWTISGASNRQRIFRLDPETGAILDSIPDPAAGYAGGMTWDGQHLWVSKYSPVNQFLEIEPANGTILTTLAAVGDQVRGLAYEGGYLWNSSQDSDGDFIYRIDVNSGAVVWQFQLPPHASLPNRRVRGLSWVDGFLWIVAYAQNTTDIRILQYDVSNAIYPDIHVNQTLHDFGAHVVGFPAQWTFSGSNIGNATLMIDTAFFSAGQAYSIFSPTVFPVVVAPFDSFSMTVEFSPPSPGLFSDTLWLVSNDPDENPLPIVLRGTGLADEGDIDVSPTELDFGEVWIPETGLSSSRTVEIHNLGFGVLTVSGLEFRTGNYFYLDPIVLPMEIDSQSYVTVRVWFDPQVVGFFSDVLTISSDDPDEPIVDIPLSGTASVAAFEPGASIWHYRDFSDDFDIGINAVHWITDVNANHTADVIASSGSGLTFCLNGSSSGFGDTLWTFNTRIDQNHSGAVYYDRALSNIEDLTGDGVEDVILGTAGGSRSVFALSGVTGEQLWTFDTDWWGNGGWVNDVASIPDINSDFVADVVAGAGDDGNGTGPRRVFALSGQDGTLLWEGPVYASFYAISVIADVSSDSIPDIVGGTTSWVIGINGANGSELWHTSIGANSPVFDLEKMGNANPETNSTEDVVVASAYLGVYAIDGGTGQQIWLHPITGSFVYEVEAGSDITGDLVREVYVGLVSGHVLCLDGTSGLTLWDEIADPVSPENILALTIIPDVTGDLIEDVVCGTLGDYLVVLAGWDGREFFTTQGQGPAGAMDAVSIIPDVDENSSWEILSGNREGTIECCAGGGFVNPVESQPEIPLSFFLMPAYPNPFNPSTTITYALPEPSRVELRVWDILGRFVVTLTDGIQPRGQYHVQWHGLNNAGMPISSGLYFVTMSTPKYIATQRLVFLK